MTSGQGLFTQNESLFRPNPGQRKDSALWVSNLQHYLTPRFPQEPWVRQNIWGKRYFKPMF